LESNTTKIWGEIKGIQFAQRILCAKILWVTIILFGSFQTVEAQKKPTWTNEFPNSPQYYIGIGSSVISENDSDYQDRARDIALGRLISGIEVNVSSISEATLKKIGGDVEDVFTLMSTSEAQQTIEDYETVDTWQNEDEYWVYLRLSKTAYNQRVQEKVAIAQSQAYTAYKDGLIQYQNGNYVTAISILVKGLEDISPYLTRIKNIDHDGSSINIFAELETSLQIILDDLRIENESGPTEVMIGQPSKESLKVKISNKETGNLIEGLPVEFEYIRGDGELNSPVFTNKVGISEGKIIKTISDEKLQIIASKISLKAFLEDKQDPLTESLVNSFNITDVRYVLKVSGTPVFIELKEIFLGDEKKTEYIESFIRKEFTASGFSFIDDLNNAEYYIEVETISKKGSETYGMFSSTLNFKISVTSLKTGEEIAFYSQSDIKGRSDSYEKAAIKAFELGVDSLGKNISKELIEKIKK
tara:strand:- start:53657 stop:55075 length:1419 start_codon:yes stop_codon:yes gene_type:complete